MSVGKRGRAEDVEAAVSRVLQVGVLASACVILVGFVMYLVTGNGGYPSGSFPYDPSAVLQGLLALKPFAVIVLGLFLLILTPILRVGISIVIFLKEKDYLYVKITAVVFTILIISLLLGKAE
jgi:uncharacterized membrane protein